MSAPSDAAHRDAGNQALLLGFGLSAGEAYAAVVDIADDSVTCDQLDRLSRPGLGSEARDLAHIVTTLQHHLRTLSPAAVGVLETTKFRQWGYRQAADRARLEAAILVAAASENIPAAVVPCADAARVFETTAKDLGVAVRARFDVDDLTYSDARAEAVAAAIAAGELA